VDFAKLRWAAAISLLSLMIYQLADNYLYTGTLASGIAAVIWLDLLMDRIIDWVGLLLMAIYAPRNHTIDTIAQLNSEQIALINDLHLTMRGRLIEHNGDTDITYCLVGVDGVDIPHSWLWDYLEQCQETYPEFIPERRFGDGSRDLRFTKSFTKLMCNHGLAQPPVGNKPAAWNVPLSRVVELFE